MRVLALDLASITTGWCLLETTTLERKASGIIKIPASKKTNQRMVIKRDTIEKLLIATKPEIVALEDTFTSQKNKNTAKVLNQFHGIVQELLTRKGVPFVYFTPTQIKKAVIHGKATKEEVAGAVKEILGNWSEASDDETDAAAIAITYKKLKGK